MFAWCWDARPYAAFPARTDVWADGANWRRGHWLNGRAGLSGLAEVVDDLCRRAGVDDADVSALTGAVSGYVVDSPSTARAALKPLMAAYDFIAADREGVLTFFHIAEADTLEIAPGEMSADSISDAFAVRADAADAPIEARVRFLDATRDYLIADASARRLDRAEGGVESVEAPLVLEAESAEILAQRVLADRRAGNETLRFALGPAHVALEPGDRLTLSGDTDAYEISRIEDSEARSLSLRRVRSGGASLLSLAETGGAPLPILAPTPALAVLDLPPLPGAEADERPLVGVYASPWASAHDLYAGADALALTRRCRIARPAILGELLWALYPGPVDRWDEGNVVRIKLCAGALVSVTKRALLDGANIFAIESDNGEWELIQARHAVLVGPREYELSGFLRGQLASAHAMRSPHPVGARIVKLDTRLKRAPVQAWEWSDDLLFVAPPSGAGAGAGASDARAAQTTLTLPHAAARPWPPAQVRARRGVGGAVEINWVRQARKGGDFWGRGDPPLDVPAEAYQLDILSGSTLVRSVTVSSPSYSYSAADQTADFGAPPSSLHIRAAQMDAGGVPGLNTEVTLPL